MTKLSNEEIILVATEAGASKSKIHRDLKNMPWEAFGLDPSEYYLRWQSKTLRGEKKATTTNGKKPPAKSVKRRRTGATAEPNERIMVADKAFHPATAGLKPGDIALVEQFLDVGPDVMKSAKEAKAVHAVVPVMTVQAIINALTSAGFQSAHE